jgi:uncharacterized SAM-binding protein YcdF (DUF218 family)
MIALLAVVILAVVAYFHPQPFLCVDSGDVKADVMVVLGGGVHDRPARAADLYSRRDAPNIILTGEGDDIINWRILRDAGVPAGAVILVTSWYHSRRALKTFQHYAPDITFYSRPSYFGFARADWNRLGTKRRLRWEFLKLPAYCLRYGINPF